MPITSQKGPDLRPHSLGFAVRERTVCVWGSLVVADKSFHRLNRSSSYFSSALSHHLCFCGTSRHFPYTSCANDGPFLSDTINEFHSSSPIPHPDPASTRAGGTVDRPAARTKHSVIKTAWRTSFDGPPSSFSELITVSASSLRRIPVGFLLVI